MKHHVFSANIFPSMTTRLHRKTRPVARNYFATNDARATFRISQVPEGFFNPVQVHLAAGFRLESTRNHYCRCPLQFRHHRRYLDSVSTTPSGLLAVTERRCRVCLETFYSSFKNNAVTALVLAIHSSVPPFGCGAPPSLLYFSAPTNVSLLPPAHPVFVLHLFSGSIRPIFPG